MIKELELSVYIENPKSIEFYKKNGFTVIKEKADEHTGHIEQLMTFSP